MLKASEKKRTHTELQLQLISASEAKQRCSNAGLPYLSCRGASRCVCTHESPGCQEGLLDAGQGQAVGMLSSGYMVQ